MEGNRASERCHAGQANIPWRQTSGLCGHSRPRSGYWRQDPVGRCARAVRRRLPYPAYRSEEPTSELQSLMRISYAVFCLKKKKKYTTNTDYNFKKNTNK